MRSFIVGMWHTAERHELVLIGAWTAIVAHGYAFGEVSIALAAALVLLLDLAWIAWRTRGNRKSRDGITDARLNAAIDRLER